MKTFARRPARIALACGIMLTAALTVGGCSNPSDQARIAELEAQVQDLQEDGAAAGGAAPAGGAAAQDQSGASDQGSAQQSAQEPTPPQADASVLAGYPDIAAFESRVADLETACDGVAVSQDADANYRSYLDMKARIDQLDSDMDAYDGQQERAARKGSIAYNDYIQLETAIDHLDDRLERAEDAMQYRLGIYDD